MNIYEKDIFDYVWQPDKMDVDVYSTIENNYENYKDALHIIKSVWDDQDMVVSDEILAKIKFKIREREENQVYDVEDSFEI